MQQLCLGRKPQYEKPVFSRKLAASNNGLWGDAAVVVPGAIGSSSLFCKECVCVHSSMRFLNTWTAFNLLSQICLVPRLHANIFFILCKWKHRKAVCQRLVLLSGSGKFFCAFSVKWIGTSKVQALFALNSSSRFF